VVDLLDQPVLNLARLTRIPCNPLQKPSALYQTPGAGLGAPRIFSWRPLIERCSTY
jgi:hypothetical protein